MENVSQSKADHIVVVTHHVPTSLTVAPQHVGSPLNSAFTVEMDDFIADNRIDYWIYGHSHTNIDAEIDGTRILANQLGYVAHGEQYNGFRNNRYFEL